MKKILIISERKSNELFHEKPSKLPPRHDLRKPRLLDDPDFEDLEEDEDLEKE